MENDYSRKDRLIGIALWAGYVLSAPLRIFQYYPAEPLSNPFEEGLNPKMFIKRVKERRTKDISDLAFPRKIV